MNAGDDPLGSFVLLSLAQGADVGGLVRPDVPRLAALADCGPSAVQAALRRLAAAGLVTPHGDQLRVDLAAALASPAGEGDVD